MRARRHWYFVLLAGAWCGAACSGSPDVSGPGGGGGNGIGHPGAPQLVVWSPAVFLPIHVTANGIPVGTISTEYHSTPACGAGGVVTIPLPSTGNVTIQAADSGARARTWVYGVSNAGTGCQPLLLDPYLGSPLFIQPNFGTSTGTGSVSCSLASAPTTTVDCLAVRQFNSQLILTATPAAGSVFAGWEAPGPTPCLGIVPTCALTLDASDGVRVFPAFGPEHGMDQLILAPQTLYCKPGDDISVLAHIYNPGGAEIAGTVTFSSNNPSAVTVVNTAPQLGTVHCAGAFGSPVIYASFGTYSATARVFVVPDPNQTFRVRVMLTGQGNGSIVDDHGRLACTVVRGVMGNGCAADFPAGGVYRFFYAIGDQTDYTPIPSPPCDPNDHTACSVLVDSDTTLPVTLTYDPSYLVSIALLGGAEGQVRAEWSGNVLAQCTFQGGIQTPNPCSLVQPSGRVLHLRANLIQESTYFNGWGGDCASFGRATTCDLTLDAVKNVFASFGTESQVGQLPTPPSDGTVGGGGPAGRYFTSCLAAPTVVRQSTTFKRLPPPLDGLQWKIYLNPSFGPGFVFFNGFASPVTFSHDKAVGSPPSRTAYRHTLQPGEYDFPDYSVYGGSGPGSIVCLRVDGVRFGNDTGPYF